MTFKVNFLICGTQKGGTTALADYLRLHPQIHIPARKELHFFDNENICWQNPPYWHYHRSYQNAEHHQLWGDATPIYMYWKPAVERIWRYNSSMRLIATLRNPISRAYSHWAMEISRGKELLSFDEALKKEEHRCRKALPQQHRRFSYLDRGFYSEQLRRLWQFFGRDAVLILRQEELLKNPSYCLNETCIHLGIKEMPSFTPFLSRVGPRKIPMSHWAKAFLRNYYQAEISQLEIMLNWDCKAWLEED